MKVRTLVVDCDPAARARLRALLSVEPDFELVGECETGSQVLETFDLKPDLIFFDTQLPDFDGLEILSQLPHMRPSVVFATQAPEYALPAFDIGATDYLLKPFSDERFALCLRRIRQQRVQIAPTVAPTSNRSIRRAAEHRDYTKPLFVKSDGRVRLLHVHEIQWCEAVGNYVRLHAKDQTHFVRDTLTHFERQLNSNRFVRVHRSTIVNISSIRELRGSATGEYTIILRDGTQLTLSRGYRKTFERMFGQSL